MSQFRDLAKQFDDAGAQILGVSVDTHFCHQVFAEQLKLNFPLLSDFNHEIIPSYVGYYPDVAGYKQVGRRAVFVVERNGKISYKWISEEKPGDLPDPQEVLRVTQAQ